MNKNGQNTSPLKSVYSILCLSLTSFLLLALLVVSNYSIGFDELLIRAFRDPLHPEVPLGPSWLKEVAHDITTLGGTTYLTLLVLLVAGYLVTVQKYHAALLVGGAVMSGTMMSTLLKGTFARPRPDLVPHLVQVATSSFPSGHAMLSAVTYLTLGALLTRFQEGRAVKLYLMTSATLLTFLIGTSRIYLGVHWPSDVVGGWCIGVAWAATCWLIAQQLQRRGLVEK